MRLMLLELIFGLALLLSGLYLLWFTPVNQTQGFGDMSTAVGLMAGGLLLMIPAKVYLILKLSNRKDSSK